jgi:hypothetical protein
MDELQQLVDELQAAEAKISDWYKSYLAPLLENCTSLDEVSKLDRDVSFACRAKDGSSRDMPALLHVSLLVRLSVLKYPDNKGIK